jgi:serine protease Do
MKHKTFKPVAWLIIPLIVLARTIPVYAEELPNFRQLVEQNSSSVVNVVVSKQITMNDQSGTQQMPEFPPGSPLGEMFKHFNRGGPQMPMPPDGQLHAQGSGFIISPDGYVLTNAHVAKEADKIVVRLHDHEEFPATVVGMDELTDVALLKIDGHNLPIAKLGDSDNLHVGDWVLAIGSPFGLDYTATQGIVSALGRSLPDETYIPFIQTDVAVNPGNSGGPLYNTDGEVIGINSQIFSNSGGYMGLSFAVPINVARQVADQLKVAGHVDHGWLGVGIQTVSSDLAKSFGLDQPRGALVSQVQPNSPAAQGGLQTGDIILSFNGKAVSDSNQLPLLVNATPVGHQVAIEVLRAGKTQTLQATIVPRAEQPQLASAGYNGGGHQDNALKLAVTDLNSEQRQSLGERGVLVAGMDQGPATEAGIQPGDVILNVDHQDITSTVQFSELLKTLPKGKPLPVLVQREDNAIFLALTIPT